jgi:uncharacterized protein YndB with AHSA1/START domain
MIESTGTASPSPTEREVVFTRFFVAPARLVYDMWTQRMHFQRWFAPDGFTLRGCRIDPHPGGALEVVLLGPDGSERPFRATYRELVPAARIVFSGAFGGAPQDEVITEVEFTEFGAMTRMTVRQTTPHTEPYAHLHYAEWLERLTKLSDLLELD